VVTLSLQISGFLIILKTNISKNREICKFFENFFKKKDDVFDDSIIILETIQNRETKPKRKNKDKCVRFVDYDLLEIEKNTRSKKKNSKTNLSKK
jgi:hypothetical protein